jgi:hypothetical protein
MPYHHNILHVHQQITGSIAGGHFLWPPENTSTLYQHDGAPHTIGILFIIYLTKHFMVGGLVKQE